MDLFNSEPEASKNLLPHGGIVNYYGRIMPPERANHYLENLLTTIDWKPDEVVLFGKKIITKRKVAWYGDQNFDYTYSNTTRRALPWTEELAALKGLIEQRSGETFNSCLLNLYHNGEEGMGWHSDAEKELKKDGAIGSLSLGAERKFAFKHKQSQETVSVILEHGSLLLMKGETQTNWLHRLPPSKVVKRPRINLTFRTIII